MEATEQPSNAEILECLNRSGYLLESRLVRTLNENGFFVEPNQVLRDSHTGKSREIDLVAEHYEPGRLSHTRCCVKSHFVVEAINNPLPVVLLTERPGSPYALYEDYSRSWITGGDGIWGALGKLDIDDMRFPTDTPLFSQYCGLSRKKANEQLLASHLDDLYASLSKAVEYCSAQLLAHGESEISENDKYWRVFYWWPMLVLSGRLMVVRNGQNDEPEILEVDSANLEFNYHEGETQRAMVVRVVTERAFLNTVLRDVKIDYEIEDVLVQERRRLGA